MKDFDRLHNIKFNEGEKKDFYVNLVYSKRFGIEHKQVVNDREWLIILFLPQSQHKLDLTGKNGDTKIPHLSLSLSLSAVRTLANTLTHLVTLSSTYTPTPTHTPRTYFHVCTQSLWLGFYFLIYFGNACQGPNKFLRPHTKRGSSNRTQVVLLSKQQLLPQDQGFSGNSS